MMHAPLRRQPRGSARPAEGIPALQFDPVRVPSVGRHLFSSPPLSSTCVDLSVGTDRSRMRAVPAWVGSAWTVPARKGP